MHKGETDPAIGQVYTINNFQEKCTIQIFKHKYFAQFTNFRLEVGTKKQNKKEGSKLKKEKKEKKTPNKLRTERSLKQQFMSEQDNIT